MNKPATIALLVLLVAVIVFGKFHNRMFPRHVDTGFSRVTVRVPGNWIYSKGNEDFAFQLVIPSKRLAEPAGFITAKCMQSGSLDEYVAGDAKKKADRKSYREARSGNAWLCTYTARDKKREARAVEYVIGASGCLWHLVGVFDEDWYKKNGETARDFVRDFCSENLDTKLPELPEPGKQAPAKPGTGGKK
ncbi:MAG: hypothetical protein IJT95_00700 [Abditibacteriota bacterium]|nr:hypothetical protein [Abditibacteriota bacterium]